MKMENNVFGIIGIGAKNANWNADFSKFPKSFDDGIIYGSDKSLKYSMKNLLKLQGEKVFYIKSNQVNKEGKIQPRNLVERYKYLFKSDLKNDKKDPVKVLKNMLSTSDCRQFGFVLAEESCNLNSTGVVQIQNGLNIFKDTQVKSDDILSPFRNSNSEKENSSQTSIGEQIFVNEAHYSYSFTICPSQLDEFCNLKDNEGNFVDIEPYSEEDYEKFKVLAANCANAQNSCSKMGCSNEYLILVKVKDNLYLNPLSQFVSLEENILHIEKVLDYLKKFTDRIESIEIYYNKDSINIFYDKSFIDKELLKKINEADLSELIPE